MYKKNLEGIKYTISDKEYWFCRKDKNEVLAYSKDYCFIVDEHEIHMPLDAIEVREESVALLLLEDGYTKTDLVDYELMGKMIHQSLHFRDQQTNGSVEWHNWSSDNEYSIILKLCEGYKKGEEVIEARLYIHDTDAEDWEGEVEINSIEINPLFNCYCLYTPELLERFLNTAIDNSGNIK